MDRAGAHAVVIGGSMAGLCAAAALADSYDRVTVLDRDRLPEQPANRKGTPQDRHIHLLLAAGAQALSSLFPGLLDELAAAGVRTVLPERARLAFGGTGSPGYAPARPRRPGRPGRPRSGPAGRCWRRTYARGCARTEGWRFVTGCARTG